MIKLWLTLLILLLAGPALAGRDAAALSTSLSYTPVYQFETDIDSGGSFAVDRHFLRLDFFKPLNRRTRVGLGLHYDFEQWNFKGTTDIQGASPWQEIHRPTLTLPLFYSLNEDWNLFLAPSIGLAQESGAKTSESLVYGAVFSLTRNLQPGLRLGLGGGVFERLDKTTVFPFIVLDWKINEQFRLKNPFSAGPVGPAGLELVWQPEGRWELACGGAWRSYRFRLADDSGTPNGVGEVDFIASYLRSTYQMGKLFSADLSIGGLFAGSLGIEDSSGRSLGETGYEPAPFMALTFKGRF